MNLVVNARDAMSHGGTITIETKNIEVGSADPGIHSSVHPGSYVLLCVGDDGCGMDAKTLARIFEPFFTTKEQGKGTGLGLSTVYGIVKQSGGYIFVESELGRGTRFNIYLPRATEAIDGAAGKPAPLLSTGGKETILLVEDDEMVRALVRRVLREGGYDLLEASSPDEALQLCENNERSIDLLVTDIVMPGMRGDEMADILAPKRPEMKVIFTSGYTEEGVLRGTVAHSGSAFIQKPIDPIALTRAVREVLDGVSPAKI
jgi:CheY-like chemotaxis protein